ncbi:Rib/alpha-like domain-containing protein [Corynebacterium felinum]|uniref:Long Rib domain-containing protein n=1 Tax=Corynebacterium felinum TaxID=131318 RepID=A0ABU2B6U3_9CORY|nr:Rib/alpha-like domain-containing protein [Corynebacterium felinum]MDF5819548.1 Rib/alpha-like domain-containing protein [Corynebacterium felinum]MDR7354325.1 hypothetical protein [Corynebacterium felinum]WJY93701.1 Putative Ig domain protein [Corynebacterium felinum]
MSAARTRRGISIAAMVSLTATLGIVPQTLNPVTVKAQEQEYTEELSNETNQPAAPTTLEIPPAELPTPHTVPATQTHSHLPAEPDHGHNGEPTAETDLEPQFGPFAEHVELDTAPIEGFVYDFHPEGVGDIRFLNQHTHHEDPELIQRARPRVQLKKHADIFHLRWHNERWMLFLNEQSITLDLPARFDVELLVSYGDGSQETATIPVGIHDFGELNVHFAPRRGAAGSLVPLVLQGFTDAQGRALSQWFKDRTFVEGIVGNSRRNYVGTYLLGQMREGYESDLSVRIPDDAAVGQELSIPVTVKAGNRMIESFVSVTVTEAVDFKPQLKRSDFVLSPGKNAYLDIEWPEGVDLSRLRDLRVYTDSRVQRSYVSIEQEAESGKHQQVTAENSRFLLRLSTRPPEVFEQPIIVGYSVGNQYEEHQFTLRVHVDTDGDTQPDIDDHDDDNDGIHDDIELSQGTDPKTQHGKALSAVLQPENHHFFVRPGTKFHTAPIRFRHDPDYTPTPALGEDPVFYTWDQDQPQVRSFAKPASATGDYEVEQSTGAISATLPLTATERSEYPVEVTFSDGSVGIVNIVVHAEETALYKLSLRNRQILLRPNQPQRVPIFYEGSVPDEVTYQVRSGCLERYKDLWSVTINDEGYLEVLHRGYPQDFTMHDLRTFGSCTITLTASIPGGQAEPIDFYAVVDTDGDGVDDQRDGDLDGDGVDNDTEQLSGRDPFVDDNHLHAAIYSFSYPTHLNFVRAGATTTFTPRLGKQNQHGPAGFVSGDFSSSARFSLVPNERQAFTEAFSASIDEHSGVVTVQAHPFVGERNGLLTVEVTYEDGSRSRRNIYFTGIGLPRYLSYDSSVVVPRQEYTVVPESRNALESDMRMTWKAPDDAHGWSFDFNPHTGAITARVDDPTTATEQVEGTVFLSYPERFGAVVVPLPVEFSLDTDGDGRPDFWDEDDDNDTLLDEQDQQPKVYNTPEMAKQYRIYYRHQHLDGEDTPALRPEIIKINGGDHSLPPATVFYAHDPRQGEDPNPNRGYHVDPHTGEIQVVLLEPSFHQLPIFVQFSDGSVLPTFAEVTVDRISMRLDYERHELVVPAGGETVVAHPRGSMATPRVRYQLAPTTQIPHGWIVEVDPDTAQVQVSAPAFVPGAQWLESFVVEIQGVNAHDGRRLVSTMIQVEIDTDGDGISDYHDHDDDNDGVDDYHEHSGATDPKDPNSFRLNHVFIPSYQPAAFVRGKTVHSFRPTFDISGTPDKEAGEIPQNTRFELVGYKNYVGPVTSASIDQHTGVITVRDFPGRNAAPEFIVKVIYQDGTETLVDAEFVLSDSAVFEPRWTIPAIVPGQGEVTVRPEYSVPFVPELRFALGPMDAHVGWDVRIDPQSGELSITVDNPLPRGIADVLEIPVQTTVVDADREQVLHTQLRAHLDTDQDGEVDAHDIDDDNDAYSDIEEQAAGTSTKDATDKPEWGLEPVTLPVAIDGQDYHSGSPLALTAPLEVSVSVDPAQLPAGIRFENGVFLGTPRLEWSREAESQVFAITVVARHELSGDQAQRRVTLRVLRDVDADGEPDTVDSDDDKDLFTDVEEQQSQTDPKDAQDKPDIAIVPLAPLRVREGERISQAVALTKPIHALIEVQGDLPDGLEFAGDVLSGIPSLEPWGERESQELKVQFVAVHPAGRSAVAELSMTVLRDTDRDQIPDIEDEDDDNDRFVDVEERAAFHDPKDAQDKPVVAFAKVPVSEVREGVALDIPVRLSTPLLHADIVADHLPEGLSFVDGAIVGIPAVEWEGEEEHKQLTASFRATHRGHDDAVWMTVEITVVRDTDGDGIPDLRDEDDDHDGYSDQEERAFGSDTKNKNLKPTLAFVQVDPIEVVEKTGRIEREIRLAGVVDALIEAVELPDGLRFEHGVLHGTPVISQWDKQEESRVLRARFVAVHQGSGDRAELECAITVARNSDSDDLPDYDDHDDDNDLFSDAQEQAALTDPKDPANTPTVALRALAPLTVVEHHAIEEQSPTLLHPVDARIVVHGKLPAGLKFDNGRLLGSPVITDWGDDDTRTVTISFVAQHPAGDSEPVTLSITVQRDHDHDRTPDMRDADDDNDGFSDAEEREAGTDPKDKDDAPRVALAEIGAVTITQHQPMPPITPTLVQPVAATIEVVGELPLGVRFVDGQLTGTPTISEWGMEESRDLQVTFIAKHPTGDSAPITLTITVERDTDQDGISDLRDGDDDGDQYTDAEETHAGTNPKDAAQKPVLQFAPLKPITVVEHQPIEAITPSVQPELRATIGVDNLPAGLLFDNGQLTGSPEITDWARGENSRTLIVVFEAVHPASGERASQQLAVVVTRDTDKDTTPDLTDIDADNDGFSNDEEHAVGTDYQDSESTPDFAFKQVEDQRIIEAQAINDVLIALIHPVSGRFMAEKLAPGTTFNPDTSRISGTPEITDWAEEETSRSIEFRLKAERDGIDNVPGRSTMLTFTVTVLRDLDKDGTPDILDEDIDGDGYTNAEEERAGSNPRLHSSTRATGDHAKDHSQQPPPAQQHPHLGHRCTQQPRRSGIPATRPD